MARVYDHVEKYNYVNTTVQDYLKVFSQLEISPVLVLLWRGGYPAWDLK